MCTLCIFKDYINSIARDILIQTKLWYTTLPVCDIPSFWRYNTRQFQSCYLYCKHSMALEATKEGRKIMWIWLYLFDICIVRVPLLMVYLILKFRKKKKISLQYKLWRQLRKCENIQIVEMSFGSYFPTKGKVCAVFSKPST